MILRYFKYYSQRFILFIIAMQILNIGLYSQNIPTTISESRMEQNIINSITEYIAEVVLKKADAFPENTNNNQDNNDTFFVKMWAFNLFNETATEINFYDTKVIKSYSVLTNQKITNYEAEIIPPPPKVPSLS